MPTVAWRVLAKKIGENNVRKLAKHTTLDGRIYIPIKCKKNHWLTKTIGFENCNAVVSLYRGSHIMLHKKVKHDGVVMRNAIINAAIRGGIEKETLAKFLGLSEQTVRKVVVKDRK